VHPFAAKQAPMNLGESTRTVGRDRPPEAGTFETIYQHWFHPVCVWIRALGGPDADRDDIAQEVFLVVKRRLPAFDGRNLPGWLYRIAQRQVRDFRRRAWWRHVLARPREGDLDTLPHGHPGPAATLESKENQRVLYAMLDRIREPRRSTFVLFEIEGLSGEEISEIQDIPVNTVWSRLHHARRDFFALAARQHRRLEGAPAAWLRDGTRPGKADR
jgi:RNA polymerase sigma-70 factor (ECF subfamily)